jgi:hypothetical protein
MKRFKKNAKHLFITIILRNGLTLSLSNTNLVLIQTKLTLVDLEWAETN